MEAAEEWREVPGFPWYEASSLGRVRSWVKPGGYGRRDKPLVLSAPVVDRYPTVALGKGHRLRLHTVIAWTFIGPRPAGLQVVRHLDDNPLNNVPSNLAYGTQRDNSRDAFRNGGRTYKTHCWRGHEYTEANTYRSEGRRRCRTCVLARHAAKRAAA